MSPKEIYQFSAKPWCEPVLAIPVLETVAEKAPNYEGRTFAFGGVLIVSHLAPAERASNSVFRPSLTTIEVGKYPEGNWNLISKIMSDAEPYVLVNGVPIKREQYGSKIRLIRNATQKKNIRMMITHMQYPQLLEISNKVGVRYEENLLAYERLSTKSGLNSALEKFKCAHPDSPFGSFGTNVQSLAEIVKEVNRIKQLGFSAYLKLDRGNFGCVNAGGLGHLPITQEMTETEIREGLNQLVEPNSPIEGVVQILVPNATVMSISSGQNEQGEYEIYEAHVQTQDGTTADGASPLPNNEFSRLLIEEIWPYYKRFLKENNVTGKQNMNFMVLPPEIYEAAKILYNSPNMSPIVLIDFNYRAITGTQNAISKHKEETGKDVDLTNFRSRSIKLMPDYAKNPQLIYAQGIDLGLHSGPNGNFTIVNMGTFRPPFNHDVYKTQVIVSGTQKDPEELIKALEERLHHRPTHTELRRWEIALGISQVDSGHIATPESELLLTSAIAIQLSKIKLHSQ